MPQRSVSPGSVDELVGLVRAARSEGARLKVVGSGHSFSAIAVAADTQVELSRLRGLVSVDAARCRATLRAGTPLHEIPELLAPYGLAMTNLGDIDRQTLAGATSTGTHGTGVGFGGISTQIVGATLVTGYGELLTVSEGEPDLLAAVALGLGALGILVEITLQCVPVFALEATEGPARLADVTAGFVEDIARHDHYEFYWFPHTDRVLTKINRRLPADTPVTGPGRLRRFVDDELLSNHALRTVCEVGSRVPALVPGINALTSRALSPRTYSDRSSAVFATSRTVRFREMEYAVPVAAVPEVLARVQALIEHRGFNISFPVEVRSAAADGLMLSTAFGRATGYIAVHRYYRDRPDDYFTEVEQIMVETAGRPHWGKLHTRDAGYLSTVYPRFDEFRSLRDKLDPGRIFANEYLDNVLGP